MEQSSVKERNSFVNKRKVNSSLVHLLEIQFSDLQSIKEAFVFAFQAAGEDDHSSDIQMSFFHVFMCLVFTQDSFLLIP